MALGTFIAGRYSSTYDPPGGTAAADVGIAEEGYELSWTYSVEPIAQSDSHGDAFMDGVFRGISNCFIQANSLEAKAGSYNPVTPWSILAPSGTTYLGPGVIGRLMSDVAGILILTSTAGTPAVSSPATMTATYAILAENYDVRLLFHSKLRKVPIRWRILPYSDSGTIKYVTAT